MVTKWVINPERAWYFLWGSSCLNGGVSSKWGSVNGYEIIIFVMIMGSLWTLVRLYSGFHDNVMLYGPYLSFIGIITPKQIRVNDTQKIFMDKQHNNDFGRFNAVLIRDNPCLAWANDVDRKSIQISRILLALQPSNEYD